MLGLLGTITTGVTAERSFILMETTSWPEVNILIVIMTFAGFYLALPVGSMPSQFLFLFDTLVGVMLVASGTGTLNQYIERHINAQMRQTARRPLPAERIIPSNVLRFGSLCRSSCAEYELLSLRCPVGGFQVDHDGAPLASGFHRFSSIGFWSYDYR
jgi:hypothetical protein